MSKGLDQLKTSFDKLRKESFLAVGHANKIVSQGVHRLAEHELKALNDTYKSVLASIKSAQSGESIKDLASKQLDLMQDTILRLISSARESLSIVADTRQELAGLVQKGLKSGAVAEAELNKVTDKARKAATNVKAAAVDAQKKAVQISSQLTSQAKASAEKLAASVRTDAKKVTDVVKKDVKIIRQRVGSVLDIKPKAPAFKRPVIAVKPSANSRASRATSKAKKMTTKPTTK